MHLVNLRAVRLFLALIALVGFAACGETKTKTVTAPSSGGTPPKESSGADAATRTVVRGSVGDTLRTADNYHENDRPVQERLAITLLSVKRNIQPDEPGLEPSSGNTYFGVRLKITQSGSTGANPSSTMFSLLDEQGQKFELAEYGGIAKPELGEGGQGPIQLDPGSTLSGYLVFEVPADAQPTTFKYHDLAYGPPPDTAEWSLPKAE
jgi:hypothetical protein